ncbi:MAG TPA: carboxy terminal-processing peptidase [Ferruginibacter sp.]|jgi:carboxyl-terminal processing protease|nr:carboxy terminal-processing peptidase [Ferruginibacter sp.]HNA00368.1 carboxy terminal-processing peptidase [Ferruginibacter sp.]HNF02363.1 carboxy terminal-processing peptidase [Ferruginibacter sp.]HNJ28605.1 carboxy terminal-processing peptidase [Ferruginibacter sp.]HNL65469.1 carboxy terminal-processing peptidase [Ferruginibacter sp.]
MHKIAGFIMSKKFLPVLLVFLAASLFLAFQTQGSTERDNPKSKYTRILRNVGLLLEQGHYSPKKIDDNFSKEVLKKFITDMDNDRNIFLQGDIDDFRKFEAKIDDEIHGADLVSFYSINEVYQKRLNEVAQYYKEILAKPFDFTKEESVQLDREKLANPKTEAERKDIWRKRLKYMVLARYADALESREKNKGKEDFKYKADSTLEREARDGVRKQIDRYFTTKKTRETSDENFSTFVNAITSIMDPHTNYFAPVDKRSFDESMKGSFFGIGAVLKEDDGKIKIGQLISGGPAWKGGELKVDDEILKIAQGTAEPVDVTGYGVTDAVKLIRGPEKGSEVKLTVRKIDGTVKVITLLRDEIKLDDTFAKSAIINGEHKIGYIYLPEFYIDFANPNGAKCSEDVAQEVKKLKEENVEGIIIDLRGNGGGSLPEVVKMAGLFIEDGPICIVKGREEKPYQWKDKDKSVLYTGPLTVMVDEFSASASEIFAAAIQDYKRGIIIGSTSTFGKGTVQRSIPLNPESENPAFANRNTEDLGSVKLTLQKYYRINGGSVQLKGVTPDVVIPNRMEYLKFREKDDAYSLPWDEIGKADYKPWTSTISTDEVVKYGSDIVNTNSSFKKIKETVDWLDKYNTKEYSLNLSKYREEQKLLKAKMGELDKLYKLTKELNVKNTETDLAALKDAQDKLDKNNQWLKRISGDIYIDETVKVMNNMIGQSNTAKNN